MKGEVVVSDESSCGSERMEPNGTSNGVGTRKEMHREVKSLRNERQFCVLRQYLELG